MSCLHASPLLLQRSAGRSNPARRHYCSRVPRRRQSQSPVDPHAYLSPTQESPWCISLCILLAERESLILHRLDGTVHEFQVARISGEKKDSDEPDDGHGHQGDDDDESMGRGVMTMVMMATMALHTIVPGRAVHTPRFRSQARPLPRLLRPQDRRSHPHLLANTVRISFVTPGLQILVLRWPLEKGAQSRGLVWPVAGRSVIRTLMMLPQSNASGRGTMVPDQHEVGPRHPDQEAQ